MANDLAERLERSQVFRLDRRGFRQPFLQDGQDLHPLDGINSQVRIQRHVQLQHLYRIACPLADDIEERLLRPACRQSGSGYCRYRRCSLGRDGRFGGFLCRGPHRGGRDCRSGNVPSHQPLLLFKQRLDGPAGCLLPFQKLAMEIGRLLVKFLERCHAFPRHPQRFRQVSGRCRGRQRNGGCCVPSHGDRCRLRGFIVCRQLALCSRPLRPGLHIIASRNGNGHRRFFCLNGRYGIIRIPTGEFDPIAEGRQVGQDARQVYDSGSFAGG